MQITQHYIDELKEKFDLSDETYEKALLLKMIVSAEQYQKDGTDIRFLECGLCNGSGKQELYEDTWECPACLGLGGSAVPK